MNSDNFNNIEAEYISKTELSYRKSLGQFFTPEKISGFMAQWILGVKKDNINILDPAAGFGIFVREIVKQKSNKQLLFDMWEIDSNIYDELKIIANHLGINAHIENSDFLFGSWDKKYDGIIANPPYYKHHYIAKKNEIFKDICVNTFFPFSIQTNIYCWFLIKALNLLESNGRLAFIIPSEFLNSNYGEKVKTYLIKKGTISHIINIDFKENVFNNAITTSSIILAENTPQKNQEIKFFNVTDINDLDNLNRFLQNHPSKSFDIGDLNPKVKWKNYFLNNNIICHSNLTKFSVFGKFTRGIATGANNYFTLSSTEKKEFLLPEKALIPCITKAMYAKDIIFDNNDFLKLVEQNKKVFLFNGEGSNDEFTTKYIRLGEELGIDKRYLTLNRSPWYSLEKRQVSSIWVSVFGRNKIKFIWNTSQCINLTCFHSFFPTKLGKDFMDILFIYINTDFARTLFEEEKREYGNGLEKFEPNDINKSKIFDFRILNYDQRKELRTLQLEFLKPDQKYRKELLKKANEIFRSGVEN